MPKVIYPNLFPEYFGVQNCAPESQNLDIYGPTGVFSFGLSLYDAMLLIWRIKKFSLILPSGFGSAESTTTATTETDIFCGPEFLVEGEANYSSGPLADPQIEAQIALGLDAPVFRYENLYYTGFTLNYTYVSFSGSNPISFIQASSSYVENPEFEFTLQIQNSILPPIKMRASEYFGSPPLPSISVLEYWSYGGTWDTQTGARL